MRGRLILAVALTTALAPVQRLAAQTVTAFKTGEATTGLTKQCFYDAIGSGYTLTVRAVDLCPLTTEVRTSPTLPTRSTENATPQPAASCGGTWICAAKAWREAGERNRILQETAAAAELRSAEVNAAVQRLEAAAVQERNRVTQAQRAAFTGRAKYVTQRAVESLSLRDSGAASFSRDATARLGVLFEANPLASNVEMNDALTPLVYDWQRRAEHLSTFAEQVSSFLLNRSALSEEDRREVRDLMADSVRSLYNSQQPIDRARVQSLMVSALEAHWVRHAGRLAVPLDARYASVIRRYYTSPDTSRTADRFFVVAVAAMKRDADRQKRCFDSAAPLPRGAFALCATSAWLPLTGDDAVVRRLDASFRADSVLFGVHAGALISGSGRPR